MCKVDNPDILLMTQIQIGKGQTATTIKDR
jgi:hypothetical protein